MKLKHLVMSIEWLENKLNSLNTYQRKNKYCKDCFWMTLWQVKNSLIEYKFKWYEFIPWSWCENILYNGSCWC